jgi:hypothetical protein
VLAHNVGLYIFAYASAAEEALDGYQGNGPHTLLKGLRSGAADANGDKQISVSELGRYARRETARIAQATFPHAQQPGVNELRQGLDVACLARHSEKSQKMIKNNQL